MPSSAVSRAIPAIAKPPNPRAVRRRLRCRGSSDRQRQIYRGRVSIGNRYHVGSAGRRIRADFELLRSECVGRGRANPSLSTAARRVEWRSGEVTVDAAASRGVARTFRARSAVVTLPVGVLRHAGDKSAVAFDPELSAVKLDALRSIEMGPVVKVALGFRTAFWKHVARGRYRDASFFRTYDRPFAAYWTQEPLQNTIVMAWTGGPKAAPLAEMPVRDSDRGRFTRVRRTSRQSGTGAR